jgi:hypothetical protein
LPVDCGEKAQAVLAFRQNKRMFLFCSKRVEQAMPQTKKLTVEQVLEARLRYADGEQDFKKLAQAYRISRSTIANAVLGKTFKDLPMPPRSQ